MGDDEVRASWARPPVPEVGRELPWWTEAELLWMNKVVAPVRARRVRKARKPMPPPLTAEESARRLFTLPMSYWTYDFEPGVRHLGPMAQDFAAAFGLGRSNRQINMVDANGVAVIAIQVLNRRLTALQKEVDRLTALVASVGGTTADVSAGGQNGGAAEAMVGPPPGTAPGPHERTTTMNDEKQLPEDVEGHKIYRNSNRDIKHDVTPVESEETDDDVEGHRWSSSDRNIKHDISPVSFETPSDQGSLGQQPRR